jgi:hypothetical protein
MYKCGWNGCEKAYGTLNHLNAHVTMQSHGQKRTPEGTYNYSFEDLYWLSMQASHARLALGVVVVLRHFDGVPAALDSLNKAEANIADPGPLLLA